MSIVAGSPILDRAVVQMVLAKLKVAFEAQQYVWAIMRSASDTVLDIIAQLVNRTLSATCNFDIVLLQPMHKIRQGSPFLKKVQQATRFHTVYGPKPGDNRKVRLQINT